jgi:hypothetical protein
MNDDFDPSTGENYKKYAHGNGGEVYNSTIGRIGHWSGRGLFKTKPILNTNFKYVIVWNISLYRPFWLRCGIPKYRF